MGRNSRLPKTPLPKLVRDLIPDLIKLDGGNPKVKTLHDDKEYLRALNDKLFEELEEYREKFDVEELVDVIEVVEALTELFDKVAPGEIRRIRNAKRSLKGGFAGRTYLTGV